MRKHFILLIIIASIFVIAFNWKSPLTTSASTPSDYGLKEGDLISAIFSDDPDVYIINEHGYKRLFLNPDIFKFYTHLGGFFNVKLVTEEVVNTFPTSGLFRDCESDDQKVYGVDIEGEDTGQLHWVNTTGEQAVKDDPDFFKKVFCINKKEFEWYPKGNSLQTVKDVPKYERISDQGSVTTEEKFKENIRFKEEGRVLVCHYPDSAETASKSEEILIDTSAVKAHLAHGDKLGTCQGTTFVYPIPTVTPVSTPAPVCAKELEKTIDFEDDPNLGANITDNLTHSTWLESRGISLTASPSGTIWTTKMSSTFQTGVVIGVAAPDFTEQHQGLSDNESLIVNFLGSKAKTVTLTFTIKPTIGADNIPNSVTLQAYDSFGNSVITPFDKTFSVIERGKYAPVDITVSAGDFQISKLIIKSTQYALGGLFLEGIKFSVPCPIPTPTPTPTPLTSAIPAPSTSSGPTPSTSATPSTTPTPTISTNPSATPTSTPTLTTSPSPVVSASYSPTPTPTPTPTPVLATTYANCGERVKNVPADYSTIQAAINASSPGDTIRIAAGIYNEGLTINKSGICIDGAGIDQTIITKSDNVGIYIDAPYIIVRNFTVKSSNSYIGSSPTNGMGGGIFTYNTHDILIQSCRLTQNSASTGGGLYANSTTNLTVNRCLVDNNRATNMAGGIYIEPASTGTIVNVTVANNTADRQIGGLSYGIDQGVSNRNLTVYDSIFYGNVGPMTTYSTGSTNFAIYWTTTSPSATVNHSDIGGWSGGTNNINVDPKFVSTTDYHLQSNSPAANMGIYPVPVPLSPTPTSTTSSVSFDNFSRNLANVSAITRDLYVGSLGSDVKQLQAFLVNEVGYSADLITGYFGRITRDAVQRLQEKYGVKPVSGYFGTITRKALNALISQ